MISRLGFAEVSEAVLEPALRHAPWRPGQPKSAQAGTARYSRPESLGDQSPLLDAFCQHPAARGAVPLRHRAQTGNLPAQCSSRYGARPFGRSRARRTGIVPHGRSARGAPPRPVDETVEPVADCCQFKPIEHRGQMIVFHHQRPPTTRSYSNKRPQQLRRADGVGNTQAVGDRWGADRVLLASGGWRAALGCRYSSIRANPRVGVPSASRLHSRNRAVHALVGNGPEAASRAAKKIGKTSTSRPDLQPQLR